ncbi:MAG: phage terminase large subunit [Rickettsiales bacterium]|jgi:predicted phage terminase large subunit-like protein|nr:phage terminase large subunit [Rickettsiales bacterium]
MQDTNRLVQAVLRNNFSTFVAKSFLTVSPGTKYLHNWHISLISEKLKQIEEGKITRLIINIPPRYLKSICISVSWSAWLMGHNPATKIMTASYSQALSNKHSQDCRILMNSPWYKELFPETIINKGENQKSKFVTSKRGFRFATSTGGTATGEGGDYLIIDDPQNPNKINSKKYRQATIQWFEQTFISRLNNKQTGAIVIVMQRLHEEDLCGYLLENKRDQWDLLKLPAIYEQPITFTEPYLITKETGSVLHEEREDMVALNKLKNELGEYNFASQYQQSPIPSKGCIIEKSWLNYFSSKDNIKFKQIIQSWDTAIKAKDDSDYSVGITVGINNNGYYLLDIQRIKAEYPELIIALQNFSNKWNPQAILIEDKGSGQSLIQSLKPLIKTAIIPIKPKFDKVTRFARHSPLFEAGKIFLDYNANWRITLEQELISFPKSPHDDQVDSLSQALEYLQNKKPARIRTL